MRLGNALQASTSGVDVPGVIFLMNDVILQEGVVFAFSAFFRSDKPIRIQIWRPDSREDETQDPETSSAFRLLFETRIIPSVINRREDVSYHGMYMCVIPPDEGYVIKTYIYLMSHSYIVSNSSTFLHT